MVMKKIFSLCFIFSLSACSYMGHESKIDSVSMNEYNKFSNYLKEDTFLISDSPYMKGVIKKFDPVLSKYVEIKSIGTMGDISMSLESIFPEISFYADETALDIYTSIDYKGSLEDTLNNISNKAGVFWEYKADENKIIFSGITTRTYIINTSSSKINFKSTISNNAEKSGGDGSSGNSRTSQETETSLEYNVMEEAKETITQLLSPTGKISVNPSAGTISVKDNYMAIQNIDRAMNKINSFLGQQVAISVNVYTVTLNDNYDLGFNLKAVFEGKNINFSGGAEAFASTLGNITAGIIKNDKSDSSIQKYSGSSLSFQALKSLGDVKILNQGSGITTHNQPFSLQSTRTEAYLKSTTLTTTDTGQDVALEPGEVTEGFSMVFTPSIRGKQLILEYNLSLITLDDLESFQSNNMTLQLPKTTTKAFNQHAIMTMGETLVIGAFLSDSDMNDNSLGLFGITKTKKKQKSLIVITVDVDNAGLPVLSKL